MAAVVFAASDELQRDLKWLENNDYEKEEGSDVESAGGADAPGVASSAPRTFSSEFAPLLAVLRNAGFGPCSATARLPSKAHAVAFIVVAGAEPGAADPRSLLRAVAMARREHPTAFIVAWHPAAEMDAFFREDAFGDGRSGCNMVSWCEAALLAAARQVVHCAGSRASGGGGSGSGGSSSSSGALRCPWCGVRGFTEDELWVHAPLYHVNCTNHVEVPCPVCRVLCGASSRAGPLPVHLRNCHGPCARGEVEAERATGLFAIVVCQRPADGHFLLVQEFAQSGFWLPGGQLDAGESLQAAVARECEEEAGVKVKLLGVIDVQVADQGRWRRVTFYAEPYNPENCRPKSVPDYESAGAVWAPLDVITGYTQPRGSSGGSGGSSKNNSSSSSSNGNSRGGGGGSRWSGRFRASPNGCPSGTSDGAVTRGRQVRLRGSEPLKYCPYVASGGEILPLAIPAEHAAAFADVSF